jgi:hypothetical protein
VKIDTAKFILTYVVGMMVLVGTFYALVLYKFELSTLIQGAMISWATLVLNAIFSDQVATRTAKQSEAASASGAAQALTSPTVTASAGDPPTVTVESPPSDTPPPEGAV